MHSGQERQLSANSAIVTIDHQGIIQSVDKGACEMFGYELEELMGQKVNTLLPTPYREQHDTYLENYHETGVKKVIGKCRLVEAQHKDGTIFPIRLSVSEVTVGDKSMYIGMLDRVEDSAGTITANHEGIIIFCNKNCEAIFGYTVGEMVGKNLCILMPPPYSEKHDSYIAEYHRTGQMRVIGHTRNVPAKHKNGTVFPICLQVTKLKVGIVELFKGRVERVCNDCEAVFTLSNTGTIVSCNKSFVTPLFGYTDTELIGQHINVLVPSLCTPVDQSEEGADGNNSRKRKREGSDEMIPLSTLVDTKEEEVEDGEKEIQATEFRGGCPVMHASDDETGSSSESMKSDFSISGMRRLMVRHKDGSTFPVDFSISKFHQDNIVFYSGRIRRVNEPPKRDGDKETAPEKEPGALDTKLQEKSSEALTVVGDYIIEGNVGQGSYGKVKLASHKVTGKKVAVKVLQKDLMDNPEIVRSKREVEIQMKLSHPNIVKLYDVIETEDRLYIIMEYSEGGELLSYINQKGKLPDAEARRLFLQLLSAVQYCHKHNIIHRDIKHKNILLDGDLNLKLIDFGLSNYIQFDHLRSTFCGTPAYAAPEMILAKKYIGPEVDIWSMGVVLYSMVCGRFPFSNVSNIIEGQFSIPSHLNPVLADLIKRMLVVDTSKRATISDVARHPWVQIGATPSAPMSNTMVSTDQLSSFMASKSSFNPLPLGPASSAPAFHHGAPGSKSVALPHLASEMLSRGMINTPHHTPILPSPPHNVQSHHNPILPRTYPPLSPKPPSPVLSGAYKYTPPPIAPAQPFNTLNSSTNTENGNDGYDKSDGSRRRDPSGSPPADLQALLNRMRNPVVAPAATGNPPASTRMKSDVASLMESYGYSGLNFPPPTKRRRADSGGTEAHAAPETDRGGLSNSQGDSSNNGNNNNNTNRGVKDVVCNVVSTEKQG